jgi:hypothetical protein
MLHLARTLVAAALAGAALIAITPLPLVVAAQSVEPFAGVAAEPRIALAAPGAAR